MKDLDSTSIVLIDVKLMLWDQYQHIIRFQRVRVG